MSNIAQMTIGDLEPVQRWRMMKQAAGSLSIWWWLQDNLIMRCVKRCTCGTKPQKPSPWHSEKNPVLWLFGDGGTNVGFLEKKGFSLEPLYFCTLVCSPCFKLGDWSADLFNPKNGHPWIGQDMVFDSMGTPGGDSNPREPNQRSKFIAGLTLPAQRNQELVITNHYKSQRSSTIIHHHPTIILPSSYHHLRFVIA